MPHLQGKYDLIVVGTSAGGFHALSVLLKELPADYSLPIAVVQHRARDSHHLLEDVLQKKCRVVIRQANEKEPIRPGVVYIAPPDYHLLVETDRTFSLSCEPPVRFSRPSIDVLFESAALVCGPHLIGVILTGANDDGAAGIMAIEKRGGLTIAQNPNEAQYPFMAQAAINTHCIHHVWSLSTIRNFFIQTGKNESSRQGGHFDR